MAVFFLVMKNNSLSLAEDSAIHQRLVEKMGAENVYKLNSGQYMFSHTELLMPEQVAEFLGMDLRNGQLGSYILVPVSAYWGFHDNSLWSWIAGKV
jgi:hypothetical protein